MDSAVAEFKNMKKIVKKETENLVVPENKTPSPDPFDNTLLGLGIPNYMLDPTSFKDMSASLGPLANSDELEAMNKLYSEDFMKDGSVFFDGKGIVDGFDKGEDWIQTYSGRRFNPLNPNPDAIVIQDIAHSLSMQCRFTGHCSDFYSIAQHSVFVSYICNQENALYGLLHDASEAYCQDIASPIKKTMEFSVYREVENKIQKAICTRFGLPHNEPRDVKKADLILLATEARDLMSPLHSDWKLDTNPLPFKITPLSPAQAKKLFMERFMELVSPR